MVVSLFDILYVTMGILFVFKYLGFTDKNMKNHNTNTTTVTDDINYFIINHNDGERIILPYQQYEDNYMMNCNYNIKYDILHDYNNTHYNYDTNVKTNEIEIIYM
jgi:hypothetical protein